MPVDRRSLLRSAAATAMLLAPPARLLDRWRVDVRAAASRRVRIAGFEPEQPGLGRSRPRRAPQPFSMLGVAAPPGAHVAVRVSADGTGFGPWLPVAALDVEHEGPDRAESRGAGNGWKRMSTPLWTGPASWVQIEVDGADVDEVEVLPVDTDARPEDRALVGRRATPAATPAAWRADADEPDVTLASGTGLRIVTRQEWGADESLRREGPSYAERVLHGIVHHTAGNNAYAPADGPRIVRGIYEYHVRDNGWNDIGYNLLVDRYGVVYEGRYGGLDLPVIGAHAVGANTGSFGVALIGDFRLEEVGWPEPRSALFELLAWKFGLHAIDPEGYVAAAGRDGVPTLAGHRDVGSTECPGQRLHALLPAWRDGLAERLRRDLTDIEGNAHEASIRSLRAAGVTTGYPDGTFRPDAFVSRAQMATFLTRAAQLEPGDEVMFRDVTSSHPHYAGIAAVAAARIAEGRGDGTFRPDEEVTRGQMAAFLARALRLPPAPERTFDDVPADHPHRGSIGAVAEAGIAFGYEDGTFGPGQPVNRGQMASFLVRAFDLPPADEGPEDPDDLEDVDDPPDELEEEDEHQPDASPSTA